MTKKFFLASATICKLFNAADTMLLQVSKFTILTIVYERLIMVTDLGNLTREQSYKKQLIICGTIGLLVFHFRLPLPTTQPCTAKKIIACISTYSRNYGKFYNLGLFSDNLRHSRTSYSHYTFSDSLENQSQFCLLCPAAVSIKAE